MASLALLLTSADVTLVLFDFFIVSFLCVSSASLISYIYNIAHRWPIVKIIDPLFSKIIKILSFLFCYCNLLIMSIQYIEKGIVIDEQLRDAGSGDGVSGWAIYDDGSEYDG